MKWATIKQQERTDLCIFEKGKREVFSGGMPGNPQNRICHPACDQVGLHGYRRLLLFEKTPNFLQYYYSGDWEGNGIQSWNGTIQCLVQSATKNPIKERFQEKGLTKAKDDRFTMRSYLTRQKTCLLCQQKNQTVFKCSFS